MTSFSASLALRSAARTAPAAFWAAFVDVTPVLREKAPPVLAALLRDLRAGDAATTQCASEASLGLAALQAAGAEGLPTWEAAAAGARAPPAPSDSDFSFDRGWQGHACSFLETTFLEQRVRPGCDETRRALLWSQGGSGGAWLRAIPSETAFVLEPLRFQVAMRRRLRWRLPFSGGWYCAYCRDARDGFGDRTTSCPTNGHLK